MSISPLFVSLVAASLLCAESNPTPKLRLGHYSSADGTFGVVFDRTATPPRAKIDGQGEVLELAVRRHGEKGAAFHALHDAIVIDVGEWGTVTAFTPMRRDIELRRDADPSPLAEPTKLALNEALTKRLEVGVKEKCGTSVRFEAPGALDAAGVANGNPRGAVHTLHRAARALEVECRDRIGRDAVQKMVRTVRVTSAPSTGFDLASGTFTVRGELDAETFGPFTDEMKRFLEGKL